MADSWLTPHQKSLIRKEREKKRNRPFHYVVFSNSMEPLTEREYNLIDELLISQFIEAQTSPDDKGYCMHVHTEERVTINLNQKEEHKGFTCVLISHTPT